MKKILFSLVLLFTATIAFANPVVLSDELNPVKLAIDYDTEVGTIQYEERDGELWVTNATPDNDDGIIKIPAYKDGKKIRGIKYNADFDNVVTIYFLGTDLEVLPHNTIIDGQTVLDYYEHPNWRDTVSYLYMPNVKEIPPWYFMRIPNAGLDDHSIHYFYGPNVERIDAYAFAETYLGKNAGDAGYTPLDFPSLKFVGANAFMNTPAKDVRVPELLEMDASTFGSEVTNLYAPKVRIVKGITSGTSTNNPNFRLPYQTNSCFKNIENVYLPSCEEIGNNVFHFEDAVDTLENPKTIYMPKCKRVGDENWFFNVTELVMPECYDWNGRFITGVDIEHPTNYFKIERSNPPRYDPTKDHQIRKSPSEFEPNTILRYVNLGTKTLNDNAFRGCEALQVVELPNLEVGAKWAFANCKSLYYVEAPKMIHGADYMFYNCNKLGFGDFSSLQDIGEKMFSGCSEVSRITGKPIDRYGKTFATPSCSYNTEKQKWVWYGSTNITGEPLDIVYPSNPTNAQKAIITWNKFIQKTFSKAGCGLYFPKVQYIGKAAFRAYDPDDYTPPAEGEDEGTWQVSGNLRTINLPTVKEIGPSAFRGQRKLWSLNIPKCEIIDEAAFQRCASIVEDDLANEIEHVSHPFGKDSQFLLPSARIIKSRAFAHTRFGYVTKRKDDYPWWGLTVKLPNATYIAPDAFYDTWKILDVYAPLWAHTNTLFELKEQYKWGYRESDVLIDNYNNDIRSVTNVYWLGFEHENDFYGERVNLWNKMNGPFVRERNLLPLLPKSFSLIYSKIGQHGIKKALFVGPFEITSNDVLTLSFDISAIGALTTNTVWTLLDCYDGTTLTVELYDEETYIKDYEFDFGDVEDSKKPWIEWKHFVPENGPDYWNYELHNEENGKINVVIKDMELTNLTFNISAAFSYMCLANIEVRKNGQKLLTDSKFDKVFTEIDNVKQMNKKLTYVFQDVVGSSACSGIDTIEIDSSKGSVQLFDPCSETSTEVKLILPAITNAIQYGSLTIFIRTTSDTLESYYFANDNCYSPWFPSTQPWNTNTEDAFWKIKWESPPGIEEWYFMGAEKYPY